MSETFGITAKSLEHLFIQDNIRSGKSLEILYSMQGIPGLCSKLNTSQTRGISSSSQTLSRELHFGNNHPYVHKRRTISEIIFEILQDTVIQILIFAAIVSLIIGTIQDPVSGWLEGFAILCAVIIVTTVTATNDYLKDGQFIKLNLQTNISNVIVTRDGQETEIPVKDLLVGDIIFVSPGEIFPVDGVLIKGGWLSVDESAITGESKLLKREVPRAGDTNSIPFVVSGARVCEGNGSVLVCAVGAHSVLGKNRMMTNQVEEEPQTPLQERLSVIAESIGKLGFLAGSLLTTVLLGHLIFDSIANRTWGSQQWSDAIASVILGITILVVAIPEGLPLALTLSMAYSIIRMKKENIFVRHLKGCEVMGAATNILSDKTGTLTQNKMTVTKSYFLGAEYDNLDHIELPSDMKKLIAENVARNTTGFLKITKNTMEVIGNQTEGALLSLIHKWGYDYSTLRNSDQQRYQFAFNSNTKIMTTVYETEKEAIVYSKGAGEVVLDKCTSMLLPNGQESILTQEKKSLIKKSMNKYCCSSLRVLGIAMKTLNNGNLKFNVTQEEMEKRLVFLGFVGIEDPLRSEARQSVIKAQRAGVIVRMVTGDKLQTAISVARNANIISEDIPDDEVNEYVIKGKKFREFVGGLITDIVDSKVVGFRVGNIEKFKEIIGKIRVLARCSPDDKLLMVIGLREMGEVVGVTGDGSNDAPALKQSDIGLAMMSGTQLAKESSDIILLDDNFESVLNSIKWGRNVYCCIRKFLQFQLTVNIVALLVSIAGALTVEHSPLSAVQMLWVNLIMDALAALALATDSPTDDLFNTKPFGRTEPIITFDMYINIITQTIYQIIVLMIILFFAPTILKIERGWGDQEWTQENGKHFTIFFHTFVMLQLFNEVNCKKLELSDWNLLGGFFSNWMFVGILSGTFLIQFLFVEIGGEIIKCSRLSPFEHLFCMSFGAVGLFIAFVVRFIGNYLKNLRTGKSKKDEDKYPLIIKS
jgi:P-type Ca2+ transporter type 2B